MRLLIASLTLSLALASNASSVRPIAIVPFHLVDNRIFVAAFINGRGPFEMMFDTGAVGLIHAGYADRLHLAVRGESMQAGTGAELVRTGHTTIREIRIGSIVLKESRAVVMPNHDGGNVFGTFQFAGLVGRELMDQYVIRIDYRQRELAFYDQAFEYSGSGDVLTCDEGFNIPVVAGAVDGIPARLGLDTGARTSIVLYGGFIAENHLREKYQPKFSGITGWGIGGPIRTDLVPIDNVTLGSATIRHPVARFTLMKTGLTAGNRLSALIGPDILKRFIVYVDMPHHRMILEKGPLFDQPEVYDRSGMWIGQEQGAFVVLDVMPGSPASKAGFAKGDRILAVDATPASKLLLPQVRERFRTEPEGAAIVMITERDGNRSSRRLVLRDFLQAS